jgi:hypothetical protein
MKGGIMQTSSRRFGIVLLGGFKNMRQKIAIIIAISVVAGIVISIVAMIVRRRLLERRCSESLEKAINECNRKLQDKPQYDFSGVRVIKDSDDAKSDDSDNESDKALGQDAESINAV